MVSESQKAAEKRYRGSLLGKIAAEKERKRKADKLASIKPGDLVCRRCFRPWDQSNGKKMCPACREKSNQRMKRHYHKNKDNGICVCCAKPSVPGKTMCKRHLEVYRAKYMRAKSMEVPE